MMQSGMWWGINDGVKPHPFIDDELRSMSTALVLHHGLSAIFRLRRDVISGGVGGAAGGGVWQDWHQFVVGGAVVGGIGGGGGELWQGFPLDTLRWRRIGGGAGIGGGGGLRLLRHFKTVTLVLPQRLLPLRTILSLLLMVSSLILALRRLLLVSLLLLLLCLLSLMLLLLFLLRVSLLFLCLLLLLLGSFSLVFLCLLLGSLLCGPAPASWALLLWGLLLRRRRSDVGGESSLSQGQREGDGSLPQVVGVVLWGCSCGGCTCVDDAGSGVCGAADSACQDHNIQESILISEEAPHAHPHQEVTPRAIRFVD